jgi:hypothetical protein
MAQVKVTVTDDDGKVIGVHDYGLDSELNTLSKMEVSIEQLRPRMLSDITKDLLEEEQKSFKKKLHLSQEGVTKSESKR